MAYNVSAYIRACSEGMTAVKRGRLAVLGAGGDGKTSFIDRLTGRGFNKAHIVTDGIEAELSCTVDVVNCTEAWIEHRMDQGDVLEEAVMTGLYNILNEHQYLDIEESQIACKQSISKVSTALRSKVTGKRNAKLFDDLFVAIPPQDNADQFGECSSYPAVESPNDSPKQSVPDSEAEPETARQLKQVYIHATTSNNKDQSDIEIMDFGGQWMYYMLLHPLEGSITFIAQDPCRAPRGRRPRGVRQGSRAINVILPSKGCSNI